MAQLTAGFACHFTKLVMRHSFLFVLFISLKSFGQKQLTLNLYGSFLFNVTASDRTITNNSSGLGLGLTLLANTKTKLQPLLELKGFLFTGTKDLYVTTGREPIEAKELVSTIFAGGN